jgi:hypothetical protein
MEEQRFVSIVKRVQIRVLGQVGVKVVVSIKNAIGLLLDGKGTWRNQTTKTQAIAFGNGESRTLVAK